MQAVLANGTLANFSPDSNAHLWRAMQVSFSLLPDVLLHGCLHHTASVDIVFGANLQSQWPLEGNAIIPRHATEHCMQTHVYTGVHQHSSILRMRQSHAGTQAHVLFQVSVGRLGIITQLTMHIVPQQSVQRSMSNITASQFADQMKLVQDAYTQAKASGSAEAIWTALHSLNETQVGRLCLQCCVTAEAASRQTHVTAGLCLPLPLLTP